MGERRCRGEAGKWKHLNEWPQTGQHEVAGGRKVENARAAAEIGSASRISVATPAWDRTVAGAGQRVSTTIVQELSMGSSVGTLVSIQRCPGSRRPMQPVSPARLIQDFGLEKDRHARAGSERQILLIEEEVLQAMNLRIGEVKENLTTRGIVLSNLDQGQILQIGSMVRLRITEPCRPCSRMDEIRAGLQQDLEGRRGVLAKVESGGSIAVGDPIRIL